MKPRFVLFQDRDGGDPQTAIVLKEGSEAGEGASPTILKVLNADGSQRSAVEAVPAGQDVGDWSGTFTEVE